MSRKTRVGKKSHIKQKKFQDRNISALEDHVRHGRVLKTPFSRVGGLTPRSWVNECLPNVLWACLLASSLRREHYLSLFRSVVANIRERLPNYEDTFVTHNHLETLSHSDFDIAFEKVLAEKAATQALSGLLLIDCLPDRAHWQQHLPPVEPQRDWNSLARAVATCFDHQSQAATDIRWLKVVHMVIAGKLNFTKKHSQFLEELRLYPTLGDMREVRPMIRAIEMSVRSFEFGEEGKKSLPAAHNELFWREVYDKTGCLPARDFTKPPKAATKLLTELSRVSQSVACHFHETLKHTGIDPRHDSSFGLVLYAVQTLIESSATYNHTSAIGRAALRTIVECYITLSFLRSKDDSALWAAYREYGSGQAKLSFLKNLSMSNVPRVIDLDAVETLVNEDKWLEFQDVPLGGWKNLREMAIEAGLKEVYDQYYDWCSGYSHGHWIAIRDSSFVTCANPLHRFHRIPAPNNLKMPSITHDGVGLITRMLDLLAELYPDFDSRVDANTLKDDPELAEPPHDDTNQKTGVHDI